MRKSVVSSELRSREILLPGFEWSPVGGRVGSRSRRWVPVWSGVGLPAPAPAVVPSVAAACGSVLLLSSPAFLSAVASGRCPVALSLASFRWPLRSAVLGSLLRVLASSRVRSFVASPVCRPAVRAFVRSALASLGFSVSGRFLSCPALASSFLARGASSVFVPSFFCVGVSSRAVVAALWSLSRCLRWLSSQSRGLVSCPPALRGLVACLALVLLPLAV